MLCVWSLAIFLEMQPRSTWDMPSPVMTPLYEMYLPSMSTVSFEERQRMSPYWMKPFLELSVLNKEVFFFSKFRFGIFLAIITIFSVNFGNSGGFSGVFWVFGAGIGSFLGRAEGGRGGFFGGINLSFRFSVGLLVGTQGGVKKELSSLMSCSGTNKGVWFVSDGLLNHKGTSACWPALGVRVFLSGGVTQGGKFEVSGGGSTEILGFGTGTGSLNESPLVDLDFFAS